MIKIQPIITFMKIIECGSFARAAKELHLTVSAVSKQINELELSLQNNLFDRKVRGIKLTKFGSFYHHKSYKLLQDINNFENQIKDQLGVYAGKLRISTPTYFLYNHLLPFLDEFLLKYPKIELSIITNEVFPNMKTSEIDLVYAVSQAVFNASENPDIVVKTIKYSDFILCASPAYLKKTSQIQLPEDLQKANLIDHNSRFLRKTVILKNNQRVIMNSNLSMNDSVGLVNAALEDLGVIQIHSFFVLDKIQNNELVQILPEYTPKSKFGIYYKYSEFIDPKIKAFTSFFTEKLHGGG